MNLRAPGRTRVSSPCPALLPYLVDVQTLGRVTLLAMIPANLFIVVWVWMGRIVFGVGGWFLFIFLVSVVPILLAGLVVTTVLAYTQHGRPRSLTAFQTWAQLATWLCLFLFGAFTPDFGDAPDSELSLLTQVFGWSRSLLDLSYDLMVGFGAASFVAYLVLLLSLVLARRPAPAVA